MSFKSFKGLFLMSRDLVTGHKYCHSSHSMVIISLSLSLRSFIGHYMSCDSVTGHKDCHSSHLMFIIWCHAFQYLVIMFVIEVIHWSLYVMWFSNLSSRLSFMSFNGHYMMSCHSVAGHKCCHSSHSMVIIRCHVLQ